MVLIKKEQWGIIPKIEIKDSYGLSLIYTPGVGRVSEETAKHPQESFESTNRASSYAVILNNPNSEILIPEEVDSYPFILNTSEPKEIAEIIINLAPTFAGFMLPGLSSSQELEIKKILATEKFNLPVWFEIPKKLGMENINLSIEIPDESEESSIGEKSLELHRRARGAIQTTRTKSIKKVSELKNNLVAIISDGSSVLGLGNIGAEAALPVMEGKSALFKTLGNVNAVPICLKTQDTKELINIIRKIAPVFGGINLEDISAPRCFEIEKTLTEILDIPVFHDDQHGTAVVVLAAFINALKLTGKNREEVKIVINGAGAGATAVSKLLLKYGVKNIILCDRTGAVFEGRIEGMNPFKKELSEITNLEKENGQLKDIIRHADFFVGLSAGNIVNSAMINSMAEKPVIFALANPIPEIMPEEALKAGAFIVATGRSDFQNQVNNSLAFPGIFRGVLDCGAKKITETMKISAAKAIAGLIPENKLTPKYIIPHALDMNVPSATAEAVIKAFRLRNED